MTEGFFTARLREFYPSTAVCCDFQFYPSTAVCCDFQFYPSTAGAVPLPFQERLNLAPLKGELSRSD